MKKQMSVIISLLMVLAMTLSVQTSVFAQNGPSKSEDNPGNVTLIDGKMNTECIFDAIDSDSVDKVEGVTYSIKTNTLTLNNVNKNATLQVFCMGDDFKIKVVGSNSLDQIYVLGGGKGAGVHMTGTGAITLNEKKENLNAILIDAENSLGLLEIDETVKINAYAVKDTDGSTEVFKLDNSNIKNIFRLPVAEAFTSRSENEGLYYKEAEVALLKTGEFYTCKAQDPDEYPGTLYFTVSKSIEEDEDGNLEELLDFTVYQKDCTIAGYPVIEENEDISAEELDLPEDADGEIVLTGVKKVTAAVASYESEAIMYTKKGEKGTFFIMNTSEDENNIYDVYKLTADKNYDGDAAVITERDITDISAYEPIADVVYSGTVNMLQYTHNEGTICKHTDKEIVAAKKETCTTAGNTKGEICKQCGSVFSNYEIIPATGHNYVSQNNSVKATCVKDGKNTDKKCSNCGDVIEGTVIPATGHNYVSQSNGVKATCTKDGKTTDKKCSKCGNIEKGQVIPATGHNYVSQNNGVKVTCTKDGKEADQKCSKCDKLVKGAVLPKLGHDYSYTSEKIEPTCTTDGKERNRKCERCGYSVSGKTIEALGHSYVSLDNAVKVTCTTDGKATDKQCSRCDKIVIGKTIAKTGHDYVSQKNSVKATCTKDGKNTDKKCSNCGDLIVGKVLPALGHDYVSMKNGVKATCTKDGKTTDQKCSRCKNVVKGEVIEAKGHSIINKNGAEATCTKDGKYDDEYCTVCKKVIKKGKTIKALGHDYQYTSEKKEPTCTADGKERNRKCSRCNKVVAGKTLEALGHNYVSLNNAEKATCTENGKLTDKQCSRCENVVKGKTVKALGHSITKKTTDATLKADGSIVSKCKTCGEVTSTVIIYRPEEFKLSQTVYTYDGKVKTPTLTVKDSAGKVIKSSNYTVTKASGRKTVGTYAYTVKMKGNYTGTATVKFTIIPKGTSFSKIARSDSGDSVKLTWKKQTTQTSGYEITITGEDGFEKVVKVSKNTTTTTTVKDLDPQQSYKISIKTYKTVKGDSIYSEDAVGKEL